MTTARRICHLPRLVVCLALLAAACGEPDEERLQPDGWTPPMDGGQTDAGPDPPDDTPFTFVVFGDTQPPADDCTSSVALPELLAFPQVVAALKPDFVLHVGDLVDMGRNAWAFTNFVSCYSPILASYPVFPTAGNHDLDWLLGGKNYKLYLENQLFHRNRLIVGENYKSSFPIIYEDDPTPYSTDYGKPTRQHLVASGYSFKTFYSFRHRNAAFLSLELTTRWEPNTPLLWLSKHLALARANHSIQHLFVYFHKPIYSTFQDEASDGDALRPVREYYEPLLRRYDVTMVFYGHTHAYDRFYVPDDGIPEEPPSEGAPIYSHDGRGIHYVTIGPAGANYLPPKTRCDDGKAALKTFSGRFLQARRCGHNLALVRVAGHGIDVEVMGVKGSAAHHQITPWDRFFLR